jgi:ABC-2 type transport system ATP-binding protein
VVALAEGRLVAHGEMTELAGASGGVELELVEILDRPSALDEVEILLRQGGAEVRRSGGVFTITGRSDDDLFDLTANAVAASGARLRRLGRRRRTLDDIFATAGAESLPTGDTIGTRP